MGTIVNEVISIKIGKVFLLLIYINVYIRFLLYIFLKVSFICIYIHI